MRVVMDPGWIGKIKVEASPAMHRVVDQVAKKVRQNQARHVRTGAMLASVHTVHTLTGGRIYVGTDHWAHVEYGTRPHIIRPKHKKALYWVGARHPVNKVHHPGTRAYAPMRKSLKAIRVF